jgi:hypothetical protein
MVLSPQEVQTRLLLPFFLARRNTHEAVQRLQDQLIRGHQLFESQSVDTLSNAFYRDEALRTALLSLFGETAAEARYLCLKSEALNRLFPHNLSLLPANSYAGYPVRFNSRPGIEIFLSPFGVGVLSMALELETERLAKQPLAPRDVLAFNYRLSQWERWNPARIRLEHPGDDAARWERIPLQTRANIPQPPLTEAPLEERLAAAGGEFALHELSDFLLQTLVQRFDLQPQQRQYSVYTVVRFDEQAVFSNLSTQDELRPFLAALSQVEEPNHPGSPAVENVMLNPHHWAAVSCLGAAHLVSNQPGELAFNRERVARSRDKYFVPFLMAYLQRLAIQRTSEAVGTVLRTSGKRPFDACGEAFREILQDTCEFAALAYLPEVSTREAVNRYYRLSQAGTRVHEAWSTVSQSIANLEAGCRAVHAETHAERTLETLTESRKLQAKVEWVEVFIIAVYVAHLVDIVGHGFEFPPQLVGGFALVYSVLAMWLAFYVLNPSEHVKLPRLTRRIMVLAITGAVLFLVAGSVARFLGLGPSHGHSKEGQQEKFVSPDAKE